MVEISLSGSGEGPRGQTGGYSTIHKAHNHLTFEAPFELRKRFEPPRANNDDEVAPPFVGKLSPTEIDVQDARYRADLALVEGGCVENDLH